MADAPKSIIQIIILILGLIGLYYLYKYLFSSSQSAAIIIQGKQNATSYGPRKIETNLIPPIYMGGEFSVSTWINVNNWGIRSGANKSILRIGGNNFDTIRIYLGAVAAQLMVRFDTKQGSSSTASNDRLAISDNVLSQPATSMMPETYSSLTGNGATASNACDILQIDMQRWVHLVVAVNGMTCDVYLDGKLARSCILDNYYNVDPNYSVNILDDGKGGAGGFGGAISTTKIYGQALGPDAVYQDYMAGPEPVTNFLEYIVSFFQPSAAY